MTSDTTASLSDKPVIDAELLPLVSAATDAQAVALVQSGQQSLATAVSKCYRCKSCGSEVVLAMPVPADWFTRFRCHGFKSFEVVHESSELPQAPSPPSSENGRLGIGE